MHQSFLVGGGKGRRGGAWQVPIHVFQVKVINSVIGPWGETGLVKLGRGKFCVLFRALTRWHRPCLTLTRRIRNQ